MPAHSSYSLPFQLQSYRGGKWVPLSGHHTEETAKRALGRNRRARPESVFRIACRPDDTFIHDHELWAV